MKTFLKELDSKILARLRDFLDGDERPEGTFCLEQLYGYLFAIASAPVMAPPSQWLSVIFNDKDAIYRDMREANDILQAVMAIYNQLNAQVLEREPRLPGICQPVSEAIKNLEFGSPLSQWAQGFLEGHNFLVEMWDEGTPEALDEELGSCLMILSFFADIELAETYHAESSQPGISLETMADSILKLFPEAMSAYANLGRAIYEVNLEQEQVTEPFFRDPKIGRNDPCPCGSGKKYKHCCLH